MLKYYVFFTVLWLATLASVVVAFSVVGNPLEQKDIQSDVAKLMAINSLQNSIGNYASEMRSLPDSLDSLKLKYSYIDIVDPETKVPFTYQKSSNTEYKICANFKADSAKVSQSAYFAMRVNSDPLTYRKGYDCLVHKVNISSPTPTIPAQVEIPVTFTPTPVSELPPDLAIQGDSQTYQFTGGSIDSISKDAYGKNVTAFSISQSGKQITVLIDRYTQVTSKKVTNLGVNDLRVGNSVTVKYFRPSETSPSYARNIEVIY